MNDVEKVSEDTKEENIKKTYEHTNNEEEKIEQNPYAYLDRQDFTSEKFKIEVRGMPRFYGVGEFKKLLSDKLKLKVVKVKPLRQGGNSVFVSFIDEENRQTAIEKISHLKWKNSMLTAQIAKAAPDPLIKRKLIKNNDNDETIKKPKLSPEEQVKLTTTPLAHLEYNEQLKLKSDNMKKVIEKLGDGILNANRSLSSFIKEQKSKYNNLICEFSSPLHLDNINNYRNKCEFTIGRNRENKIIIGFRLSSYADGSCEVGPIEDLCHIPQKMKEAVKVFEKFVQNSDLDAYNPITYDGNWKQVTARTSRLNHLMLIIDVNPKNMSTEQISQLKSQIKDFFESGEGATVGVTSLYFQTIERKNANGEGGNNIEHLSGSQYIEEKLLDMTFQISPHAFFQVNTLGAELLYQTAIDLAKPTKDTSMIDVCCGTGSIGICFSKYCGEVLGLEIVSEAILNARQNATINKADNCEFFVGEAEKILTPVICRATKSEIIAVVDPPRAGLHQKAILAIRKAKKLKNLIYISCDPYAAMKNIVDLARSTSKQYSGEPFVPVKAVPVDVFPHTKHCEMILLLQRISSVCPSTDNNKL